MTRIASLGMYDSPGVREANDALWALIAARLSERGVASVPPALDRERPLEDIWDHSDTLLAQCCGYPLATRYRGRLRYVATPSYAAPGCAGTSYRSRIVVHHRDPAEKLADLRGRRAAVNAWHSNSGMNMFRSALAPLAGGAVFFATVLETGAHEASLGAVAAGEADVASIDTVSFAHLARERPKLAAQVRTIGWTAPSPGLPFVTSITTSDDELQVLRAVVREVAASADAQPVRDALLLNGMERLPGRAYDRLVRIAEAAASLGYPDLS